MTETTTSQTSVVGEGADAITYDVHGDLASATADRPTLLLIGAPMDAVGFTTLVGLVTDRPVVTYDPRGAGRNPTGTGPITVAQHVDDVHRVIEAVGAPVDLLGSSGGAVTALALAATHPRDVRRVVAHEPPAADPLPDRDRVLAVCRDLVATYDAAGEGPAMAKFIAFVMHEGEVPADYLDRPAPDPAMFGMSADDDGVRTNPLIRNMPDINAHPIDADALRALGDRLVLGVGATSGEILPARGARAVAALVGARVVEFPGGHNGFSGGEYGQPAGEPEAFAETLLGLLA
ncbi:alpha/beta fold hydrolase [Nocardioides sp. SYSU D00038]|uniref:alpha/beta fold hydrolase n=1 Tax=Nocardioides sp. SYSU D00038 TaxID=2812554 RepID=UPI001967BB92|nr:alpha/beta hydrolase [Nocardioides sp. SYSU D00038]